MKCCFIADKYYYGNYDYYDNKDSIKELLNLVKSYNINELVLTDSNEFEYNIEMYFEYYDDYKQYFDFKLNIQEFKDKACSNYLEHCFNLISECDFCVILNNEKNIKDSISLEKVCLAFAKANNKQYLLFN